MPQSVAISPPFQDYPQLLQFLEALDASLMKLGTDRVSRVLDVLGNPQDQVPTLHVAGTNGKGTTCALLESIYRHAGLKTGLFISPHLVDIRERIQYGGQPVSEWDFLQAAGIVFEAMSRVFPDRADWLTYFEFLTVMAFWHFAALRVDVAIIETGLGGRLDATNVIQKPLAVVITPVSFDHQSRLGHTLEEIAFEKAGIIKPGCRVFSIAQSPEVDEVLVRQAQAGQASLIQAESGRFDSGPLILQDEHVYRQVYDQETGTRLLFNLLGRYQLENLTLVNTVIAALQPQLPVSYEAIKLGLRGVNWPGRFQFFSQCRLVVDGSHNIQGIHSLLATLREDFPDTSIHWGLTLLANRDPHVLSPLLDYPKSSRVYLLQDKIPAQRFHAPEVLLSTFKKVQGSAETITQSELMAFCSMPVAPNELKIVTGSLYTAGKVLSTLRHI